MSNLTHDIETGVPDLDFIEQAHAQQSMVSLAEAREISKMSASRGWAIVCEFLGGSIERNKERLVTETDQEKVRRLQERTQAFIQVLSFVGNRVVEASVEAQELESQGDGENKQPDPDEEPDNQEQ